METSFGVVSLNGKQEGGKTMACDSSATIAFGRVNAFIVVIHSKEQPSDAGWVQYVDFCLATGTMHGTITKILVITSGGAPTTKQRKYMHEIVSEVLRRGSPAFRVAIVTPSTFVRGLVNAMNLVSPVYRAFFPSDITRAYEYIDVPPGYVDEVERMIASLHAELGLQAEFLRPRSAQKKEPSS